MSAGAAGLLRVRTRPHEAVDLAQVPFADRFARRGKRADIAERVAVPERLQVVLERLAADRDALLEYDRGLHPRQRVPFERVRRVGEFDVVPSLQRLQAP